MAKIKIEKGSNMNQDYSTVSVTANIIESITQVLNKLEKDHIEIPVNVSEVVNDIQAAIARKIGGV